MTQIVSYSSDAFEIDYSSAGLPNTTQQNPAAEGFRLAIPTSSHPPSLPLCMRLHNGPLRNHTI